MRAVGGRVQPQQAAQASGTPATLGDVETPDVRALGRSGAARSWSAEGLL
jgi:hypothetical protein